MKTIGRWQAGGLALLAALTGVASLAVRADVRDNPYLETITNRNIFALRPPPPPDTNQPPPPPPAPLAKVVLTGITSMFGPSSKRALLEITETEQGKQATVKKPILREGEREGPVEVLSIDVEKSLVRIRNGTVETNLTFESRTNAPAPGSSPTMPVMPPAFAAAAAARAGMPQPGMPQPGTTPVLSPTVFSRDGSGGSSGGSGVTIIGSGNPTTPTTPTVGGVNPMGGAAYGTPAVSTPVTTADGLRLPTRTVRTVTTDPQQQQQPQAADPVMQAIQLKAQELRAKQQGMPFPPLPPLPSMQQIDRELGQ
jgi:hypothetical protein